MKTHEIIGKIAAIGMLLSILLLIWTKIDWRLLLKFLATCFIFFQLCYWYDEEY